jgi:hypothetical protein
VKVRQRIVRGEVGPPKSRHGRRDVPISSSFAQALRKHRAEADLPSDFQMPEEGLEELDTTAALSSKLSQR